MEVHFRSSSLPDLVVGRQSEASEDSRCDNTTSSTVLASIDEGVLERERTNMQTSSISSQGSTVGNGALELLGLLRILGEGYRLSCMHRCQVYKCESLERKLVLFLN